jgi:hypothetical protein
MSPRTLRFVVGTSLLALGGCTSSSEKIHTNPGPDEHDRKAKAPTGKKAAPEEPHVNVGPDDERKRAEHPHDEDGDGRPDYAINPGPQERHGKAPPPDSTKAPPSDTKQVDAAPH